MGAEPDETRTFYAEVADSLPLPLAREPPERKLATAIQALELEFAPGAPRLTLFETLAGVIEQAVGRWIARTFYH